jgi:polyhydroxyalkanoate synthesis regulator protein
MSTTTTGANELFNQAVETFETAIRTGVKMQEEYARWFAHMLSDVGSPQEWQSKGQTIISESMQMAQKNFDEAIRMMNENTRTGLELMQQAFETRQAGSTSDAQARTREIWETALGALRNNTEAVVQANSRMLETWAELAKKLRSNTTGKEA